jgi:hypothetical protein
VRRDPDLGRALRHAPPPDAESAAERARTVVLRDHAASAKRPRARRPLRALLPIVVGALLIGVTGAVAATPPGDALTGWLRGLLADEGPPARPALDRLPAAGRVLASGPSGAWVVSADGRRRRLGDYRDATWSPRGLFVAAVRGRTLAALEPDGAVRWALARPERIRQPRWAPSGFRVAYRSGPDLRVVAGDGSGDRLVASRVRPVAPAWRPGSPHVLAWVQADGRVAVRDLDRPGRIQRRRPGLTVTRLAFSASGDLLMSGPSATQLWAADGGLRASRRAAAGERLLDVAPAHRVARRMALVRRARDGSHAVVVVDGTRERVLFSAAAPIASVTWSPDGRFVLADWAGADQWLFLPVRPGAQATASAAIASQFASGSGPPARPDVDGWCCEP